MQRNFKVVFVVSTLLLFLSISVSLLNFTVSVKSTKEDLARFVLPLSLDNIYSEIQHKIIEPHLISSVMAHNTFVIDWLQDEVNESKIQRYLSNIKSRFDVNVTFLASERTKNHYTHNGLLGTIDGNKSSHQWYYRLRDSENMSEMNIDYDKHLNNRLMLFINYKLYDDKNQFVGIVGTGFQVSIIDTMFKEFREKYMFRVYFVNDKGDLVLCERSQTTIQNLNEDSALKEIKNQILSKNQKTIEFSRNGDEHLLNSKYLPQLDLFLVIEAKVDDFTEPEYYTFYSNLAISLLITFIVTIIILMTIRDYNKKLELMADHDPMTGIYNRRAFMEQLHKFRTLSRKTNIPLSLLFFDIDNFKKINDTLGHQVGDEVLKRVVLSLGEHLRESDIMGRWGGEEFIIALNNTDSKQSMFVAQKLRGILEQDPILMNIASHSVTASFGLSTLESQEELETLIKRADHAMYEAKRSGKNRVVQR